jgi:hypothetical protein
LGELEADNVVYDAAGDDRADMLVAELGQPARGGDVRPAETVVVDLTDSDVPEVVELSGDLVGAAVGNRSSWRESALGPNGVFDRRG